MRPERLELSGFTSFREPTVIDFEGADFFALVGPTGSGKSSLIDAMCFALYGSVPRYNHKGLVAPVITQGKLEARVRLDFSVDGASYSAVRVVKRTGQLGNASTKEARLEKGSEILAGTADELTAQVEKLLGLTFDHFTRCVVLPQGEFSKFLHDKAKDRQDMVIKLLNLKIYERMRQAASIRSAAAKTSSDSIEQRLANDFADATKEALGEAKVRRKALEKLRKRVDEAAPALDEAAEEIRLATSAAAEAEAWVRKLGSLKIPTEVSALSENIRETVSAQGDAEERLEKMRADVAGARETYDKLPPRSPLERAIDAHVEIAKVQEKVDVFRGSLAEAAAAEQRALADLQVSDEARSVAAKALDEARTADLAAVVGRTLELGAPCPVCLQEVGAIPHREHLESVEKAEGALAEAEAHLRIAQKKLEDAVRLKDKETVRLEEASERIDDLKLLVETYPDVEVAKASLLEIEQAEMSVREATDSENEARKAVDAARKAADRARVAEADARQGFEKTRDGLAPLGPPSSGGTDLSEDWRVLSSWAAAQIPVLEKQASEAHTASRKAEELSLKITQELAASCDECEVVVSSGRISESVAAALATASERVERIEHAIETVERLKQEFAEAKAEHALCNSMAQHLSAKAGNFESWVVNEALQRLVGGATEILRELSDGQYSLGADDSGAFLVIDHHNADESRPARTLSGGETFLASLALALALSDQLAEMAAEGSAKLESIFLDEGFGTLDPETLAVVGESIARLAATGRMVGVITHVRELAEQIPLRFQVRKEASGSVIERLSA